MRSGTGTSRWIRAVGLTAACGLAALATPAAADPRGTDPRLTDRTGRMAHYVALGDSYTAGPGIPNQTADSGGCGRSDRNYPHLVAAALAVERFTDVSCGGATTADMAGPQALPGGWRPGDAPVKLASPQLDALSPDVDLVTLGIGGNDIGFGEIILTCAAHSLLLPLTAPCRHHYTRAGDELSRRIDETAPKVAAVLAAISDRAPEARVLVVGYPVILPASGPGCWPLMPVAVGDVAWLRTVQHRLNAMLAGQAVAAGATFVDAYTSSIGHDVCRFPGEKWVEGMLPTAPASPVHPNALGMANTARQVRAAL